ncbi:hypothetical protein RB653_009435 [Dictyostelium firmibasis]|uniref:Uncharacterized protein n=1 Tax=Dictyostelium firmibasis TaxID=79012 RepID=A0AAN7TU87_9MYCE
MIKLLLIVLMIFSLSFQVFADIDECNKIQCNIPKCPPGAKLTHSRAVSCCPILSFNNQFYQVMAQFNPCDKVQCSIPRCPPGSKLTFLSSLSCCPFCAR